MLVILYINAFVAAYCNSLVNVALVDIMEQFSISATAAQWLVSGYTIVTVIMVMSMAFVYRRFTTQQIFYAAQVLFIVSGVGCALAPNFAVLLVARLVQGVATGLSTPLMMNAVMVLAAPSRRGFAMGVGSTIITLGPAFAPVLSGVLTTVWSWHAIFVPPLLISVCVLVAGRFVLRNLNERVDALFDAPSAVVLAVGLTLLAFGLTRIVSDTLLACALLAGGLVVMALFARRQGRLEVPFLLLSPLKKLLFWPCCLLTLGAIMATFSVNLILPLYFEQGLGFTALTAGLFMIVMVAFNTATGLAAGALLDRFGAWPLIPLGFACIACGQVVFLVAGPAYLVPAVVVGGCLVCAGVGLTSSPSQVTGLSSLEPDLYPHGVSIVSAFIQLAGCLAPALYVGVMNSVQTASLVQGQALQQAVGSGMLAGEGVALGVTLCALALSLVYTLVIQRRARKAGGASGL